MKSIGTGLFTASIEGKRGLLQPAYARVTARELRLQESWFRDAIFDCPELVIAPCRASGMVPADEAWLPWGTEVRVDAGPIDVLLVSSHGRIGIVETKLSYNPQKRREVVAQVLDYALSLQEADREDLPELPVSDFAPDAADLQESLASGNLLLVIAGDALDRRALRLSQALLARHLTSRWDLAMVDLNLFRPISGNGDVLLVPELLGTVQADVRHVVTVKVEGDSPRAKVVVEHVTTGGPSPGRSPDLPSLAVFLERVKSTAPDAHESVAKIISRLQDIVATSDGRFGLTLKAGVNFYWRTADGVELRIFAFRDKPRFRIWLDYLFKKGFSSLAQEIASLSRPLVDFTDEDKSGYVDISANNAAVLLELMEKVVELIRLRSTPGSSPAG